MAARDRRRRRRARDRGLLDHRAGYRALRRAGWRAWRGATRRRRADRLLRRRVAAICALAASPVLEVDRTGPAARRRHGKDDDLDAIAPPAPRSPGSGPASPRPDGQVEALRVLRVDPLDSGQGPPRRPAAAAERLVAAPDEVRDQIRNLTRMQLIRTCAAWRPDTTARATPRSRRGSRSSRWPGASSSLNDEIANLDEHDQAARAGARARDCSRR